MCFFVFCMMADDRTSWNKLRELSLAHCHCLRMEDFLLFLAYLPSIESVVLEDMFREPPKGCSYVGLSAGTGLGMSSAIVSNQQELIAVNGNAIEAVEAPSADVEHRTDDDVKITDNISEHEESTSYREKCQKCGLIRLGKTYTCSLHPQPGPSQACVCLDNLRGNSRRLKFESKLSKVKRLTTKDVECMAHSDEIRSCMRWASSHQNQVSSESTNKSADGKR